jgi:hypothetical protein
VIRIQIRLNQTQNTHYKLNVYMVLFNERVVLCTVRQQYMLKLKLLHGLLQAANLELPSLLIMERFAAGLPTSQRQSM